MDKKTLLNEWLHEQEIAHIKGWDFSHIRERYREEDDLPWDFESIIKSYLSFKNFSMQDSSEQVGLSHWGVEIGVIYEWLSFVWFIADSAFLVFFYRFFRGCLQGLCFRSVL